jgi:hypothetical protein
MDRAATKRWLVLLSALTGTVVAILYPVDDGAGSPGPVPSAAGRPTVQALLAMPESTVEEEPVGDPDPFAPRGWQAAPPPVAAPVAPVPATLAAVAPPAPPMAPPLPFRFVGGMTDGAEQLVYLGRGDEAVVAKNGEVLDGTYKVVNINASQIEFEHIPTGQKQALVFPARDN